MLTCPPSLVVDAKGGGVGHYNRGVGMKYHPGHGVKPIGGYCFA